jgi:hypothetical protein
MLLTSLFVHSAFLASFWSTVNTFNTFSTVANSSFFALSAKLVLPRLLVVFFILSIVFSTHSISLSLSSVWMISMSRIGSTSPSTWMTSASSNARTTWKMPSTALTCDKNAFPSPAPVDAPAVNPAISMQVKCAGTRDAGLYRSQSHSKRASGTGILASSGLIVA